MHVRHSAISYRSPPSSILFPHRELLLNNNLLRVLPNEIGKLFHLHILGLHGNPLGKDVLSLYNEPNGTHKLITFLLDNLTGESSPLPTPLGRWTGFL